MRPARPFVAAPRHPITGKQFRISARSARELAACMHVVDTLRIDYRHGRRTAEDVDRNLRRLVHGPVTIQRAVQSYARVVAPNTRRRLSSWMSSSGFPAELELEAIEAFAIEQWIGRMRRAGYAETTIATQWKTLCAIAGHAVLRGWIRTFPWGAYRPKLRPSFGTRLREAARSPAELELLLNAARAFDDELRALGKMADVEAKITCGALLGLRQGELAGLRWNDIDWDRQAVAIRRQYAGAPVKQRTVAVLMALPRLFDVLAAHRSAIERAGLYAPSGPVFPCARYSAPGAPRPYARGECLSSRDLRSVVAKSTLPNVAQWSSHSLRDSFATLEHSANPGDLRAVMKRTRHRSLTSFARYLRSIGRGDLVPPGFSLPGDVSPRLNPKK